MIIKYIGIWIFEIINIVFSFNLFVLFISYFRLKVDILGDIVCGIILLNMMDNKV